jgi:hypothetical protein
MSAGIAFTNLADTATHALMGTQVAAVVAKYPLSNLKDPQPRKRCQTSGTDLRVLVTLAADTPIGVVAMLSTTLITTSQVRVVAKNAALSTVYDSGTINAQTNAAYMGNVIFKLPSTVSAKTLEIEAVTSGAPITEIGRLFVGPLWTPAINFEFGTKEGRTMLGRRDRNQNSGTEFPVEAIFNPRKIEVNFPAFLQTEVNAEIRNLHYDLGVAGDALIIPETTLALGELNARTVWGAVNIPGEFMGTTQTNFDYFARNFSVQERV